jgi:hypothetical protein
MLLGLGCRRLLPRLLELLVERKRLLDRRTGGNRACGGDGDKGEEQAPHRSALPMIGMTGED